LPYTRSEIAVASSAGQKGTVGRLAGPLGERDSTLRHRPDRRSFFGDADRSIAEAVQRVAEARGIPMAQVALAWVLKNPVVEAPIVGATKPHHLPDAVAALDIRLSQDECARSTSPTPHTCRPGSKRPELFESLPGQGEEGGSGDADLPGDWQSEAEPGHRLDR
jgi:hypothetical protein